jgi:serine/threonine protein kinase/tetratricopeptide (TPR) repeat protein
MPSMVQTRLGRFELGEQLGSGGMGEVFRARDPTLGRDVAVKCLPAPFAADPRRLVRFAQEARAASALNHPNIVTIHEVGECDGQHFIVMELIEGVKLRQLLAGRPLPVRQGLDVAIQVAQGLAKSHAAGIIHRDLKPENLMLTEDGLVKILDFGLAKLFAAHDEVSSEPGGCDSQAETPAEGTIPHTAFGAVLGTAGYMAPEQAKAQRVDFRADQFALGAILYEMLTGRRAFQRATRAETQAAIIEAQPEPVGSVNPGVPTPLCWIVERCLAKEKRRRYASTLDLARELEQVRANLDSLEREGSGPHRSGASAKQGPAWRVRRTALSALVTLGVLATLLAMPASRDLFTGLMAEPLPAQKQIAVLPFSTDSQDPEVQAFADGLVDTLTSQLTQLQQFQTTLSVVPSVDVRQAAVTSAAAARSALGATLVVTGSLQRLGERVRLNGSLVDAEHVRQLRSFTLDEATTGLALQDGVVERVVRMLELELAPEARAVLGAGAASVPGAHAAYVEGRGYLQSYEDAKSLDRALTAFQRALEIDPDYPLAYAGLAETYWRRFRLEHDPALLALGEKAAERALRLNDLIAPVHVTAGQLASARGEWERAAEAFTRALALDPANADAYRELGSAYQRLGRFDEAEATYRRAIELRPGYWANHNYLGTFLMKRARYEEAEGAFRRVAELAPDNARGLSNLGGALIQTGRNDEASTVLRRSIALRPNAGAHSNLGTALFRRGKYAEAARAYERATALSASDSRAWRNLGAAYYWAPGERHKATAAYAQAATLLEKERSVNPRDASTLIRLADCYAMTGRKPEARDTARRALLLAPRDTDVLFMAGELFEILGDRSRAVELIADALGKGYPWTEVETSPALADLRQDPRLKRQARS